MLFAVNAVNTKKANPVRRPHQRHSPHDIKQNPAALPKCVAGYTQKSQTTSNPCANCTVTRSFLACIPIPFTHCIACIYFACQSRSSHLLRALSHETTPPSFRPPPPLGQDESGWWTQEERTCVRDVTPWRLNVWSTWAGALAVCTESKRTHTCLALDV